jgi:hypothetical protein
LLQQVNNQLVHDFLSQQNNRLFLFSILNNIRMPTHLVNVIKQMYDGDEYVLIDGAKTASTGNSTAPLRGVKQ